MIIRRDTNRTRMGKLERGRATSFGSSDGGQRRETGARNVISRLILKDRDRK